MLASRQIESMKPVLWLRRNHSRLEIVRQILRIRCVAQIGEIPPFAFTWKISCIVRRSDECE